MSPLVSILVPNYNHARFLPQRLDTIIAQTFQDYELIVLDDCSNDNSREVLTSYASRVPMRLIFNEQNSGSTFIQWQKGAAAAVGKYLWIAESDDFADPNFLQRLVTIMEQSPNVGLAYCGSTRVSADGMMGPLCEAGNRPLHETRWSRDYQNHGRDEVARYFVIQNIIPNASAVLVRRDVFQKAVRGAELRRLSGDWWTWVRILLESDLAFVAEPMNFFRMHDRSVRETTKSAVACAERFSLQAYVYSHVSPTIKVRARSFQASYGPWRHYIRSPAFEWDWKWFAAVRRDAQKIYPLATARMLAGLIRAIIECRLPRRLREQRFSSSI